MEDVFQVGQELITLFIVRPFLQEILGKELVKYCVVCNFIVFAGVRGSFLKVIESDGVFVIKIVQVIFFRNINFRSNKFILGIIRNI